MPVQQTAPLTLDEIVGEIREFERKYNISTVTFVAADGEIDEVDEDDAVEWLYRVEQFRTLQRPTRQTSRTERATSVSGCVSEIKAMEELAA
jgi:hypothetical protein